MHWSSYNVRMLTLQYKLSFLWPFERSMTIPIWMPCRLRIKTGCWLGNLPHYFFILTGPDTAEVSIVYMHLGTDGARIYSDTLAKSQRPYSSTDQKATRRKKNHRQRAHDCSLIYTRNSLCVVCCVKRHIRSDFYSLAVRTTPRCDQSAGYPLTRCCNTCKAVSTLHIV